MGVPAIGLQTIFGLGQETTFGTAVAPTRWLEITKESLKLSKNTITSKAIRPGGYHPELSARRKVAARGAS